MKGIRKGIAAVAAVAALALGAACGSTNPTGGARWDASADTTKSAASLSDYVRDTLTEEGMDQSQHDMLERALQHDGMVSRADYLTAWDNYRQCMVSKGYTEPPLTDINGIYLSGTSITTGNVDTQQVEKFTQDDGDCWGRYLLQVDTVYRMGQGNPELYVDLDTRLVDCLHRHNLVADDYTVAQFKREDQTLMHSTINSSEDLRRKMDDAYSFDMNDPQVLTCIATNNPSLISNQKKPWKPLG